MKRKQRNIIAVANFYTANDIIWK